MQRLQIEQRYCGPPGCAHGGYLSGLLANHSDRQLRIRLLQPIPLQQPLVLERGADGAVELKLGEQALARGQAVFLDNCAGCHRADGGGLRGVFPRLMGSSAIQATRADTVIRIVLQGAHVPSTPAKRVDFAMPAFAWKLDDAQVSDVVSYIRNAWGNRASPVSADAVAEARRSLANARAQR
ncbi:MAG: c-type cytochrome [Steroidobacteraceae bacterium]